MPTAVDASPQVRWLPGPTLAVGHRLFVYDLARGRLLAEVADPERVAPRCLSFSPRREHVAVVGNDGTLTVWRVGDRRVLLRATGWADGGPPQEASPYCAMADACAPTRIGWFPDGQRLSLDGNGPSSLDLRTGVPGNDECWPTCATEQSALAGFDVIAPRQGAESVTLVHRSTGAARKQIDGYSYWAWRPAAGPDVLALTSYQRSGTLLCDATAGRALWRNPDDRATDWSPSGDHLAGHGEGSHVVLDARTGATIARWQRAWTTCGGGRVWGRDGVAVLDDDAIHIWRSGHGVRKLGDTLPNAPGDGPEQARCESCGGDGLRLAPNGTTLATTRRLWNWETGRVQPLGWTCTMAHHLGFSNDSQYLAFRDGPHPEGNVVAFRADDGGLAVRLTDPACEATWVEGSHTLSVQGPEHATSWMLVRADDGARAWLVPGADLDTMPIVAIDARGVHDGAPSQEHLPEGIVPGARCQDLVRSILAGGACNAPWAPR